ncbi:hypothetical protein LTR27_000716 [Elasticomyces elasticus]|nr:hypothetical protein LTR27_000716 [Elasticomyces elasticus]
MRSITIKKKAGSKSKKHDVPFAMEHEYEANHWTRPVAPNPAVWEPPPAKRPDIFMTLPPELRNQIYEDVLTESHPIARYSPSQRRRTYGSLREPYQEPALVQVSKAIRQEAITVYYGINDFDIETRTELIPQLCTKLRQLVQRCGVSPFRSMRIAVTRSNWESLSNGRHLGMLFYETGLQVNPGERPRTSNYWWYGSSVLHDSNHVLQAGLRKALELGTKGARDGWTRRDMDSKLDAWLKLCMNNRKSGPKTKGWKLAMEL